MVVFYTVLFALYLVFYINKIRNVIDIKVILAFYC